MSLMNDVKSWFGKSDGNKGMEDQKKQFKEKLEQIKENGFKDKRVYDKSELENLIEHSILNSYMIGVEEERSDEESKSSLEKLVMINLFLTGILVIVKLAPVLGLT